LPVYARHGVSAWERPLVLAIEQAESARDGKPSPRLDRLSQDSRGWMKSAARLLEMLGMSPTSRARLAGDLAGRSGR
jgi:hypothetical protein